VRGARADYSEWDGADEAMCAALSQPDDGATDAPESKGRQERQERQER